MLAEIGAYPYGQQNDRLSEQVIGSLDAKARDAFTSASSALSKAEEAESKGDEALGKVKSAKDAADRAKNEADVVLARAEQLREQVEALSPRTLSVEQQRKIATVLRNLRGQHPTVIESYSMDGEGTALATQLIGAFEASGHGAPGDGRADQIVTGGFE